MAQRVIGSEMGPEVEIKKAMVLSYCILTKAELKATQGELDGIPIGCYQKWEMPEPRVDG